MPNRREILDNLLELLPSQFEIILTLLDESGAFQPGQNSDLATRVTAFLRWAERKGGCGLETVENELKERGWWQAASVPIPSQPAGFSTLRRETERFFGRTDKLEELERFFQFDGKLKIAAAYGLPGVGKTQFALRYANDHHTEYQFTFFIVAATPDSLNEGFSELASRLRLPIVKTEKPSQQDINRAVVDWLENNDGWLAIYDNADDAAILELMFREYLPKRGAGHVLLTTRETTARLVPRAIPLDIFSEDDGAKFLLDKTGQKDESSARKLTQAVGGLPLALDQAVAYIIGTDCSIKSYLENYRKEGKRLRETHNRIASDHDSVATTFSLAFKPIAEKHPATADILRICAFCAPDNIPEELFRNAGQELGEAIAGVIENDLDWDNALKEATRFSLLKRNPETSMLTIHRVVQDVIRDEMNEAEQRECAKRLGNSIRSSVLDTESKDWEVNARFTYQICEVAVIIERFEYVTVPLLNQIAHFLRNNLQLTAAESLFERVLKIETQESGFYHPNTATALNNLARIKELQAQHAEAELLYKQALEIREKALGTEHLHTTISLNNLGILYFSQGRYAEARQLLIRTLRIKRRVLEVGHLSTAVSLKNLGDIYLKQGRYDKSERRLIQALETWERVLGIGHPDTASSLDNLAKLYLEKGQHTDAELLFERSLRISEQALGPKHPDITSAIYGLGVLYLRRKEFDKAELFLQRSFAIDNRAFGIEHPKTADSTNTFGELRHAQGRHDEAETFFLQALDIRRMKLGGEHPDTGRTLNHLAELYVETGRAAEARPLFEEALKVFKLRLGDEHPDTKRCADGLKQITGD